MKSVAENGGVGTKRILILATAGAGGDLQPLIAAALGLRQRGHELIFVGDGSVSRAIQPVGIDTIVAPSELDLGPRLIGAIRDSQGRPAEEQGEFIGRRMDEWAGQLAPVVRGIIEERRPELLVTSL